MNCSSLYSTNSNLTNLTNRQKWLKSPFTQFPKAIDSLKRLGDCKITGTDKTVLRVLFGRITRGGGGRCFPRQQVIADDAGVSIRSAINSLNKWRALGVIDWVRGETVRSNEYYILRLPFLEEEALEEEEEPEEEDDDEIKSCDEIKEENSSMDINNEERMKKGEEIKNGISKKYEEKHNEILKENYDKQTKKYRERIGENWFEERTGGGQKKRNQKIDDYKKAEEVLLHYRDAYDRLMNKGRYGEDRIEWRPEPWEIKKIVLFQDNYGRDTLKSMITDVFEHWNYYQGEWKITDSYPSISVIMGFGKGQIQKFKKAVNTIPPKKESSEEDKKKIEEIKKKITPFKGW